jgi:hypothetical protein
MPEARRISSSVLKALPTQVQPNQMKGCVAEINADCVVPWDASSVRSLYPSCLLRKGFGHRENYLGFQVDHAANRSLRNYTGLTSS